MSAHRRIELALGVLLLVVFAAKLASDLATARAANSLWMCHVANLLLALSLLARSAPLAQASVLWILCGFPLWVMDMLYTGEVSLASMLAHAAGLAVSIHVLRTLGMGRRAWIPALALLPAVQLLSRWLTPSELNVNLAHRIYEGSARWFASYPAYWSFLLLTAAAVLFALSHALAWRFPATRRPIGGIDA